MSDDEGSSKKSGYRLEYATSARAKCKGPKPCQGTTIAKGELRVGSVVDFRGNTTFAWRHWGCTTTKVIANMKKSFSDPEDLDGYEDLKPEDQEKIKIAWEEGHVADEDIPESAQNAESDDANEGDKDDKKKTPAKRGKKGKAAEDDEEKPKKATRGGVASKKKAPKKTAKDDDEGDQDDEPPKKKQRATTKKTSEKAKAPAKKRATKKKEESDEEQEDFGDAIDAVSEASEDEAEDKELAGAKRKRPISKSSSKPSSSRKPKSSSSRSKKSKAAESEDE